MVAPPPRPARPLRVPGPVVASSPESHRTQAGATTPAPTTPAATSPPAVVVTAAVLAAPGLRVVAPRGSAQGDGLFRGLGRVLARFPVVVVLATILTLVAAGYLGFGAADVLQAAVFEDPTSESARGTKVLTEELDSGPASVALVVSSADGIDSAPTTQAGMELTAELAADPHLADVVSYWAVGNDPALRSNDGTSALIVARPVGSDEERMQVVAGLLERFDQTDTQTGTGAGLDVAVGGIDAVLEQAFRLTEEDLTLAELVALPLTMLLLLVAFRGVVAALIPILVGVAAIIGGLLVLRIAGELTDVSIFAINLVTAMGFGLAIDYSLLIVTRFREELGRFATTRGAVVETVSTAGRTVAFSAMTVALSLSALWLFPQPFLRSFAYGGIGVVAWAALLSLVAVPAVLALLGQRINAWSINSNPARSERFWRRLASGVLRRPALIALTVTALLLLAGMPFLQVNFGDIDERVLPEDDPVRVATERLRNDFPAGGSEPFTIVVPGGRVDQGAATFAAQVSALEHIARVDSPTGVWAGGDMVAPPHPVTSARFETDAGIWMTATPILGHLAPESQETVATIRDLEYPGDADHAVTGAAATLIDNKAGLAATLPWAIAWIAAATFILLFLMFGSVVVPIKAITLNTLSLTATFGGMVVIFQHGNLADLVGFTPTGLTDVAIPVLVFTVAFGLSMDYEVFLIAAMWETYRKTGNNRTAIVEGIARTGRVVTSAALILAVSFLAIGTGSVTYMKLLGIGLGTAILIDAFIVRIALVPAAMHLAGDLNWWAPKPLRKLHDRFGIEH